MSDYQKISPLAFGLSFGILWAIGLVIISILALYTGFAMSMVNVFSTLYLGYELTILGVIIGTLWAFVDAFIGGFLVAYLYNLCLKCIR
ncbi:bacteriophage holin [Candidatus Comchoanobacter bicostacola]|uniref:Bacteriophage holin n=1 Tax=Candidatus Comchoanobacter bicostacola TaxID=2919598 RepID=A0ABY5DIJ6_9GAMM|nr:bacteriophage holin [Candidatus Comchoanobacter bicostacola]UTC24433.1 bacteriophage holin [Candidatus Comchoanobacter bicostacola]